MIVMAVFCVAAVGLLYYHQENLVMTHLLDNNNKQKSPHPQTRFCFVNTGILCDFPLFWDSHIWHWPEDLLFPIWQSYHCCRTNPWWDSSTVCKAGRWHFSWQIHTNVWHYTWIKVTWTRMRPLIACFNVILYQPHWSVTILTRQIHTNVWHYTCTGYRGDLGLRWTNQNLPINSWFEWNTILTILTSAVTIWSILTRLMFDITLAPRTKVTWAWSEPECAN